MTQHLHAGLDVGSGTSKVAVLDGQGNVLRSWYRNSQGKPLQTAYELLGLMEADFPADRIATLTCSGTGGKNIARVLGIPFLNEVIAHTKAVEFFHPQARTIIDIGGEDAKLVLIDHNEPQGFSIRDFALNTVCAAGTGAFLEQQAARLGYSIQRFSELAEQAENVPTIAGRCTVFAKSDMIHLQQNGVADLEIIAGLCFAIVRNLKTNIAKGKTIVPPLVFQGGVAANLGVRRAIRELLLSGDQELIIPEHYAVMGSIGAALEGSRRHEPVPYPGRAVLEPHLKAEEKRSDSLSALGRPQGVPSGSSSAPGTEEAGSHSADQAFLGIDVGSVSTKMVLLGANDEAVRKDSGKEPEVLASTYLPTSGRPLEAIKQGLAELKSRFPRPPKIIAAGTTGSGRYLSAGFVGSDGVYNEITAQATAARTIVPDVDTIFEIGGQDSKYIRMEGGSIADFTMNRVCAAGTGSFLEEQSVRLNLDIRDFGDLALSAEAPARMGERCTVFMQSDLVHYQQKGVSKPDLAAGLCYSIVHNYLNKVVEQHRIGERIVFQGGTALNRGIVAAFESVLGKRVYVPRHNEVTGAIGAAMLAARDRAEESRFKGFDLSDRGYTRKVFECQGCTNCCEVQKIYIEGEEEPLYFGHRCERYERTRQTAREEVPDLVRERRGILANHLPETASTDPEDSDKPSMGIPRTLYFWEWLPFFATLLDELGYQPVLSGESNKKLTARGSSLMVTETCLPLKAAHGHVSDLLDRGLTSVLLPQIYDLPSLDPQQSTGTICPFVQGLPWTIRSAIDFRDRNAQLLSPVLRLGREVDESEDGWRELAGMLGVGTRRMKRALQQASAVQDRFRESLRERGRQILQEVEQGRTCLLIVGRPYNALDPGLNMDLSQKLRRQGILGLPLDFLPLEEEGHRISGENMYWGYGQKILAAAHFLRHYPNLHPVFLTNFSCGPDAFILHFFLDILGERPFLELEIDEHTADAGVVTRLEAFWDSIRGSGEKKRQSRKPKRANLGYRTERVLYIPPMTDHLQAFTAAFAAQGVDARLLPQSDQDSLALGRKHTTGKECLPAVLTTGDILKATEAPDFDPDRAAFFMPASNGPCRFGLYHRLHRLLLDKTGCSGVQVYAPNQTYTLYEELGVVGKDFAKQAWQGVVAVDLLLKIRQETRPYVQDRAECDRLYTNYLGHISQAIMESRDLRDVLSEAFRDFDSLPRATMRQKPVVGIVGEIYVRSNPFANENVVRNLEDMGVEVWLPTIGEWIHYVNHMGKKEAREAREFRQWLKLSLEIRYQNKIERQLITSCDSRLRSLPEPGTEKLLREAGRYIDPRFEGEAILSVGKSLDYARNRVQGLINLIPFTCMPGGVVDALLKQITADHPVPAMTLIFDGQQETNTQNRLEAFVHQVYQHDTPAN
ncbi:MAG: acyl-CoA dehydratase activase [Desulfohalobiaceae bacterium]|nr:acyl-CoA dehydratase activase [Desulfohalobiaceae bacterium]